MKKLLIIHEKIAILIEKWENENWDGKENIIFHLDETIMKIGRIYMELKKRSLRM